MYHRALRFRGWDFIFLINTYGYDIEGVLACLWDAYAPEEVMEQAEELMRTCDYNCGFTYSNDDRRKSVIMIGPTESEPEFVDTLIHEIHHVAVAVADSIGSALGGETPAYISGDIARALSDIICRFGCGKCGCGCEG